jgi:GNAT superfamily N-acetyltransferase
MKNEPILEASETQLAAAVEDNLHDFFRALVATLGGELEEKDGFSRHISFPYSPMFKGVWQTRLTPENAEAAIDENIAWFKKHKAPNFFWWTATSTTPDDLGRRLLAREMPTTEAREIDLLAPGIRTTSLGAPGMAADLHEMNEEELEHVPPGFVIEEVHDKATLLEYKKVFVEGYGVPEFAGQSWVDATLHVGIEQAPWRLYLGRLNGKPVATNMLFNGGGVIGVYAIATIPEARGLGIGGAITLHPILEMARATGYRYAVLFASEMGVSVYERIGFQMMPMRLNRYLWRNPART